MAERRAKYFFSHWDSVKKALGGKLIYLFLDYDGTLSPIVKDPWKAAISRRTTRLLGKISKDRRFRIIIISGRTMKDISRRAVLKNIVYVGNHGFEIKGPKIQFKSPVPFRYGKALEEIKAKLEKSLVGIRGVIVENKGHSLTVHYRMASKKDAPRIRAAFHRELERYRSRNIAKIKEGKMILEVVQPVPWDKGRAVLWLLKRGLFGDKDRPGKTIPLYVGDDTTDEDAFEALKNRGVTVHVGGPDRTKARFYVKNTRQVAKILSLLPDCVNRG